MSIELKGLIAALIAGFGVLGLVFGVSAIVVRTGSHASPKPAATSSPVISQDANSRSAPPQGQMVQGHAFYAKDCSSCHGGKAQGVIGPTLHHLDLTDSQIAATIKNGVKGKMPAFGQQYTDPQIQSVVAYLRSFK